MQPVERMFRCALLMMMLTACIPSQSRSAGAPAVVAKLEAKSGSSVKGEATFRASPAGVTVELNVSGAPPGVHAVHLHEKGDCSSDDGESAGAHWNPDGDPHGQLDHPPSHLGDIGNLQVGNDGKGRLTYATSHWTVGSGKLNDITGKSIVVHASEDDFTSQPAGNAGARIACGVLRSSKNDPLISRR